MQRDKRIGRERKATFQALDEAEILLSEAYDHIMDAEYRRAHDCLNRIINKVAEAKQRLRYIQWVKENTQ